MHAQHNNIYFDILVCMNSALLYRWMMQCVLTELVKKYGPFKTGFHRVWFVCTHTAHVYGVFTVSVCVACLLCVCVPGASICPSKQSWQANLIWPRKGQPHSNCLSLTLHTNAPLLLFLSPPLLVVPSFLTFFLSFLCHHLYSFAFLQPIFSPLFSPSHTFLDN